MLDDLRAFELSRLYVEERIREAEKERLLLAFGRRRVPFSGFAAWTGGVLVRIGRRLEKHGGAVQTGPSFGMRQRAV